MAHSDPALGSLSRRGFLHAGALGLSALGISSLLSACGGQGRGTTTASGQSATAADAGKASGSVSILAFNTQDQTTPGAKALYERKRVWLQQNPNATLRFDSTPYENMVTVATTRSRAGQLSDTLALVPGTLQDGVFPTLAPLSRKDFPDLDRNLRLWEFTTLTAGGSGEAGIPVGAQGTIWYYNKALFTKAGLDPETPPQTWAELSNAASKLIGAGITPMTLSRGFAPFFLYAGLLVQFFPDPGDIADFRNGKIKLTDGRFSAPMQTLVDAVKAGWFVKGFLDKEDTDAEADFATGKVAMAAGQIGGNNNWAVYDTKLGKDAYGAFLTPLHPQASKQIAYLTPDLMFSLNKDSKNPAAARSWLEFIGSKKGQEIGLTLGGILPNRADVDVAGLVDSPVLSRIASLMKSTPANEVALDFLAGSASNTFFSKFQAALVSGDVSGFLSDLQKQQRA
jgi:ABC-type glycerol-3-phosphate transport system substrate-binding protein